MATPQIAKWCKENIDSKGSDWEQVYGEPNIEERRIFIGTVFALDPCGRYHHMLSPNGYTSKCGQFWVSLEKQLEKRGLSLESGEGDPCDMFAVEWRDTSEVPE